MVPAFTGDDFFLLRPANGVVVIPDQLDLGIVGIAAGESKEHPTGIEWRHLFELVGQQHGRFIGASSEQLGVVELTHLLIGHLGQFFLAVANRRAPQSRHTLKILLALIVCDVNPVGAFQHHGPVLLMLRKVCRRVQQVPKVHTFYGVIRVFVVGCKPRNFSHIFSPDQRSPSA